MIHITPDALGALLEQSPPEFTRPVFEDPALRASIDRVFRCWAGLPAGNGSRDHGLWEEALTQACGLLVQCHSRLSAVQASPEPWRRVRECLLDQLDSPPSLNALAELSGMSRFQVVRQFSRAHGLPPFAWLLQHRLRQAKTLIGDGTPISEAAAACGFADQSHLNRHFAQCFGFTPGQWRQSCQGALQ
jgi:AraC-like DNA-binding protein